MSCFIFFFFQAEDGIRDLVRSRGLGDVYKRQVGAVALGGAFFAAGGVEGDKGWMREAALPPGVHALSLIHI